MPRNVAPSGPPTPEERTETRKAIRLVALCCLGVLVVYGIVAGLVRDDAYLTRLGWHREIHFVLRDVRALERDDLGDGPVTWLVGSSILRESFDAEAIEARLAEGGSGHRVRKFAFNRGAPVFAREIVARLPVRPGDRIVTGVAEDNFQWGWLEEQGNFREYAQAILPPSTLLGLDDVAIPNRIEWSLASTPPAAFYRNQEAYRRGFLRWWGYQLGFLAKQPKPKKNVSYQPFTDIDRRFRGFTKQDWTLTPDDVAMREGSSNWDALLGMAADAEARGATLHVVYVPSTPTYYRKFVSEPLLADVHARVEARVPHWHRLPPRTDVAYMDYKHPNNKGRPQFSADLADLLLRAEGLEPPPRTPDPWLAERDDTYDLLWQGVVVPERGTPPEDGG